jgi:plastocyanin
MRRIIATFVVALVGATGLTACGDGDHVGSQPGAHMDDSGGHMGDGDGHMGGNAGGGMDETNRPVAEGARPIVVTADDFRFEPRKITMAAGEDVRIVLKSVDVAHDLFVDGVGHVVHARAGSTAEGGLSIDEPGTYKFWCTVRGHKASGMVGTITVT